jgi:hypothetical protein
VTCVFCSRLSGLQTGVKATDNKRGEISAPARNLDVDRRKLVFGLEMSRWPERTCRDFSTVRKRLRLGHGHVERLKWKGFLEMVIVFFSPYLSKGIKNHQRGKKQNFIAYKHPVLVA